MMPPHQSAVSTLTQEVLTDPDLAMMTSSAVCFRSVCQAWIEGAPPVRPGDLMQTLGNESGISQSAVSRRLIHSIRQRCSDLRRYWSRLAL